MRDELSCEFGGTLVCQFCGQYGHDIASCLEIASVEKGE